MLAKMGIGKSSVHRSSYAPYQPRESLGSRNANAKLTFTPSSCYLPFFFGLAGLSALLNDSLGRLRVRLNKSDAWIGTTNRTARATHALGRHASILTWPRKVGDIAIEVAIILEKGRDDALHEALEKLKVVNDCRLDLVRSQIENVLKDEATKLCGCLGREVKTQRHEVIETLVSTQLSWFEEEEPASFDEGGREGKWLSSTELLGRQ